MARRVQGERWVFDGNYSRLRDIILARATVPFAIVAGRSLRRTLRRVFLREVFFGGNRETFRHTLLSRDFILLWAVRTYHSRRREYRELFDGGCPRHLRLVELRYPREAEAFLRRAAETR